LSSSHTALETATKDDDIGFPPSRENKGTRRRLRLFPLLDYYAKDLAFFLGCVDYTGVVGCLAMEAHWPDWEYSTTTDCDYAYIGREILDGFCPFAADALRCLLCLIQFCSDGSSAAVQT
jgi:hypothetical protein